MSHFDKPKIYVKRQEYCLDGIVLGQDWRFFGRHPWGSDDYNLGAVGRQDLPATLRRYEMFLKAAGLITHGVLNLKR